MVIHDLDVRRPGLRPPETDPPLIIDPDTELTLAASLERLQPIAWRNLQVIQPPSDLQLPQLATGDHLDSDEATDALTGGQALGVTIGERDDHTEIVTLRVTIRKDRRPSPTAEDP